MVERINLLLKAKNITARQFAEEIGVQPSGMSHILSGRNNPSLDFVMKVVKRWPEVNINWLMFGKGEMFVGLSNSQDTHSSMDTQTAVDPQEFQEDSLPVASESPSSIDSTQDHIGEYDLFSQPMPQQVQPSSKPNPQPTDPKPVHQMPSAQPVSPQQVTPPSTHPTPQTPIIDPTPSAPKTVVPPTILTEQPTITQTAPDIPHPVSNPPVQTQPHENRSDESVRPSGLLQPNLIKKKIVKMIVLYDDHSFAEYFPE